MMSWFAIAVTVRKRLAPTAVEAPSELREPVRIGAAAQDRSALPELTRQDAARDASR